VLLFHVWSNSCTLPVVDYDTGYNPPSEKLGRNVAALFVLPSVRYYEREYEQYVDRPHNRMLRQVATSFCLVIAIVFSCSVGSRGVALSKMRNHFSE
jgi:hypothetical protein